jgi:hypothetical protein
VVAEAAEADLGLRVFDHAADAEADRLARIDFEACLPESVSQHQP